MFKIRSFLKFESTCESSINFESTCKSSISIRFEVIEELLRFFFTFKFRALGVQASINHHSTPIPLLNLLAAPPHLPIPLSKKQGIDSTKVPRARMFRSDVFSQWLAPTCKVDKMESSKISAMFDGSLVYGRENEKKMITELLLSNDGNNDSIAVTCIYSPGGIGKTTMVQLIYTDKGVVDAFDTRIIICMSEKFDEKRLIRGIMEGLTCAPCEITDVSILESIVKDELMDKKILLVLDGAEHENKSFWDYLSVLLAVARKESVVLVTTSRVEVVNVVEANHCCHLSCLSDDNCWLIFQQIALNGHGLSVQPELIEIGKHLIAKCENNTLCTKMPGGLLSRSASIMSWRAVLESELWDMDKSVAKILPAIRLSYELLPGHLKRCFTYCSLFPRDHIFSKRHLVRLWLSQSLVEFENVGLQYFEELCSRFFFQHSPLHDIEEDKFFMHGLIHDLAQYVSKNECFRYEYQESIPKGIYHFSLAPLEYQTVQLNSLIAETRDLHSFLVINRSMIQRDYATSPTLDLLNLNDLFVKFNSLRTLDLSNTYIEDLPNSIGSLRNLKFLGLNSTNIKSIPEEIGNLVSLESFEAINCYNLAKLPERIQLLVNLRHFDVMREAGFISMPVGIGKLINLESLPAFNVGSSEMDCGIKELENLDGLRGSLQISRLENVNHGIEAKRACLKSKTNLETLCLEWSDNPEFIMDDEIIELHEKVLENLQPCNNLRELIIRNYIGCQFPLWIGDSSFTMLASLILDGCSNCSVFPTLCGLPSLRRLSVQKMYGVEKIELSNISSLELLKLWEMYDLKEFVETRDDLSYLRFLSISKCPLLTRIHKFPSLTELSIHYCDQLLNIPDLPSLEFLKIEGLRKAKTLNLSRNLGALTNLEVCYCPELSTVQGLSWITSIEKITLMQCPKLDLHQHPDNFKKEVYSSMIVMRTINKNSNKVEHQQFGLVSGVDKGKESRDYQDLAMMTSGVVMNSGPVNEIEEHDDNQDKSETEIKKHDDSVMKTVLKLDLHDEGEKRKAKKAVSHLNGMNFLLKTDSLS
ncbi:hypothetical protein LUZ60_014297 [Juncus effusus]|nr:hypothetical protein LUZ60_014297 [Juncus effusus]